MPARAGMMMSMLENLGVNVIEFNGRFTSYNPPMREFEAMVQSDRLRHDGNPITTWMMGNVIAAENPDGLVKPAKPKDRPHLKIDGAVASVMAVAMMGDDTAGVDWNSYMADTLAERAAA